MKSKEKLSLKNQNQERKYKQGEKWENKKRGSASLAHCQWASPYNRIGESNKHILQTYVLSGVYREKVNFKY